MMLRHLHSWGEFLIYVFVITIVIISIFFLEQKSNNVNVFVLALIHKPHLKHQDIDPSLKSFQKYSLGIIILFKSSLSVGLVNTYGFYYVQLTHLRCKQRKK